MKKMTSKDWLTYIAAIIIINWKWLKYVFLISLILLIIFK